MCEMLRPWFQPVERLARTLGKVAPREEPKVLGGSPTQSLSRLPTDGGWGESSTCRAWAPPLNEMNGAGVWGRESSANSAAGAGGVAAAPGQPARASGATDSYTQDVSKYVALVLTFREDDVDVFFNTFERLALKCSKVSVWNLVHTGAE